LCEENEIVVFREVLKDQPETPKGFDGHQVGIVDDGREHFALFTDLVGLSDKSPLAFKVATIGRDAKRFAQNSRDGMVGM
jgi:hypothetical protein